MPFLLLLLLAVGLRLPLLANPDGLNSDHAVSALQALHILEGELSWFLWGVGYQASLEPIINAGLFLILGRNSYAVLATAFLAYALSLYFIYLVLRPRLSGGTAVAGALFVVLAAPPFLTGTFYPPRPWCLTAVFGGLWATDRGKYGWGAFLAFFALYVDFFAIQFWPALLAYSAYKAWTAPNRRTAIVRFGIGFALGAVVLALTRKLGPQGGPPLAINFRYIVNNILLITKGILPSLFAVPTGPAEFEATFPGWFRHPLILLLRTVAGLIPLGAFLWVAREWRKWDRDTLSLVLFGVVLCGTSLTGSIFSSNLSDIHANRYLLPLVWALPFLLIPAIREIRFRIFAPYFVLVWLTVQLNYGAAVHALMLPASTAFGTGANEKRVAEFLLSEGVHHGYATYWPAYRFTYLTREDPLIVPLDERSNRYKPYWQAVEAAPKVVYLFTDSERDYSVVTENRLQTEGKRFRPFALAGFHGFLVER